jgi:hypothetical protein
MALIRSATSYIPDINFGRPLSDAKVYIMRYESTAPGRDSDINPLDLLSVSYTSDSGGTAFAPQPLRTTKGGVLYIGCKTNIKQFSTDADTYKIAVYDKCGKLEYFSNVGTFTGCVQIGGSLGAITEPPTLDIDLGSIANPPLCFQDLGFLPDVSNLKSEVFNATFSGLVSGVLTLPFNYTLAVNGLDVFVNGSLVDDWSETSTNTITFTPDLIASVTADSTIRVKYRYVQLN